MSTLSMLLLVTALFLTISFRLVQIELQALRRGGSTFKWVEVLDQGYREVVRKSKKALDNWLDRR